MHRVEPFKLNITTENVGMQNSKENQKEMERAMEIAKRDIISSEQQKFRASFADFTNLIQIAQESNLRKEEIPFAITMAIAAQFAAFLLKYQTKEIEKIGLNVVKNMYQVVHKIGSIKKMTPNDYLSITLTDIPLLATSVIPSLTGPQIERMKNTINALIVPLLMKILEDNFKTTKGKGQLRGGEGKDKNSDNEENEALEEDAAPEETSENQPGLWDRVKNAFGTLGEYVFSLMPARASIPKTEEELAKLPTEQRQALIKDYDFLVNKGAEEIDSYIRRQKQEWRAMKNNPNVTPEQRRNFRRDYEKTLRELRLQKSDELIDEWKQRGRSKEVPRWVPETQGALRLQTPLQIFLGLNYMAAPFVKAITFPTLKRAEYVNRMPDDFKIDDLKYLRYGNSFLADLKRDMKELMVYYGEQLANSGYVNSVSDFLQLEPEKYIETIRELNDLTNKNGPEAAQKALQTVVGRIVKDENLQANLPQLTSENMVQAITEGPTVRANASDTPAEKQTSTNQTTQNRTTEEQNMERVAKMVEDFQKNQAKTYDQSFGYADTIQRLTNVPITSDLPLTMYNYAVTYAEKLTGNEQLLADYNDQLLLDRIRSEVGINVTHPNFKERDWTEREIEYVLQGTVQTIRTLLGEGEEETKIKNSHEVLKGLEQAQRTLNYIQTRSSSKQLQDVLGYINNLISKIKPIANGRKIPPPGYWKSLYWGVLDWIDNYKNDNWFAKGLYNTFKESILEKNAYDIQTATGLGTVTSRTIAGAVAILTTSGTGGLLLLNFGKRMLNYIWSFFKRKAVEKTVEATGSEEVGKTLGIVIENGEKAIQESIDTMWERNRRYRAKTLELSMKGAKTAAKLGVAAATAIMGAPTALTSVGALSSLIQGNKGLAASIKDLPRSAVPAVNERRKLILRRLNEENKENQGKIREIQKTRKAIASKFRTALPDITSWFKPSHHSTKSTSGHSSSNSPSLASVATATKKRLVEKARKEEREKEKVKKEQEKEKKEQEKERKKTKQEAAALVGQLQKDYEKKLEKYEKELEQYQRSQPKGTKHLKTKPVKIAKTKKPRKTTTAKILPKKPRLTLTLQQTTTKAKKPTKGKVRTHALNLRSNKRARKI